MSAKPFKVVDKQTPPLTAEEVARKFNVSTTVFQAALEALEPHAQLTAPAKRLPTPRTPGGRRTATTYKGGEVVGVRLGLGRQDDE